MLDDAGTEEETFEARLRASVVNWRLGAALFAGAAATFASAAGSYVLAGMIVVLYALGLWRSNRALGSSTFGSWWENDD